MSRRNDSVSSFDCGPSTVVYKTWGISIISPSTLSVCTSIEDSDPDTHLSSLGRAKPANPLRISAFRLLRNLPPSSCEVSANPKGLSDLGRSEGLRHQSSTRTVSLPPHNVCTSITLGHSKSLTQCPTGELNAVPFMQFAVKVSLRRPFC